MTPAPVRVAFVCVRNAGRSQMATVFAERERRERGLEGAVEILAGGTRPADHVHGVVVDAMGEVGFDLAGGSPREIGSDALASCDYVATMGCSTLDLDVDDPAVDVRDWGLDDPAGEDLDRVREIRDGVRRRVRALFDEVETEVRRRE